MSYPTMLMHVRVRRSAESYDEHLDEPNVVHEGDDIVVDQHVLVKADSISEARTRLEERCENEGWSVEEVLSTEQRRS